MIAQGVKQCGVRRDIQFVLLAIDEHWDQVFVRSRVSTIYDVSHRLYNNR